MSQHALPTLDLRHCFDHASAHKQTVEKRILVVRVNPTVARMILQDDVHTLLFQSVNHFVNKKSAALIGIWFFQIGVWVLPASASNSL